MQAQTQARLIAAAAAPLFLLHAAPAHCQVPAKAAARAAGVATLPHISVTSMGRAARWC